MVAPQFDMAPLLVVLGFGFLAALPMIGSAIGRVFGGMSEGRADEAANQAAFEQQRNNLLAQLYQARQNAQFNQGQLDLQRQQFGANQERDHLRRALVGQLLGNARNLDISVPGIPRANISGGLNFDALGGDGRAMASMMSRRSLDTLNRPPSFTGGDILTPPTIGAVPKQGGGGFLNTLAAIGSAIGGIGDAVRHGNGSAGETRPRAITGSLPRAFQIGTPFSAPPPPMQPWIPTRRGPFA